MTFKLFHLSFFFPLEYIDQPLNRFNEIYDVIVAGVMRRNALKCTCYVKGRKEGDTYEILFAQSGLYAYGQTKLNGVMAIFNKLQYNISNISI